VHDFVEKEGQRITLGWINPDGRMRTEEDWSFGHAFGALLTREQDGRIVAAGALICNAWEGALPIELPAVDAPLDWQVQFCSPVWAVEVVGGSLTLPGNSIALITATVAQNPVN
jgi:hypothetical protein